MTASDKVRAQPLFLTSPLQARGIDQPHETLLSRLTSAAINHSISGHVDAKVINQTLPQALEFLWKGYPIQK
jgi:hypothetical protein